MAPAHVLGEAGEAAQLLAAATDDLARDEEDNAVLSPELALQLLERQHHRREQNLPLEASEIFTRYIKD